MKIEKTMLKMINMVKEIKKDGQAYSKSVELTSWIKAIFTHPFKSYAYLSDAVHYNGIYQGIFVKQPFHWLYRRIVPNTTLLDLGAGMGETAFYFVLNPNASRIISYESDRTKRRWFTESLATSPDKGRIIIKGEGVYKHTLDEILHTHTRTSPSRATLRVRSMRSSTKTSI